MEIYILNNSDKNVLKFKRLFMYKVPKWQYFQLHSHTY